MALADVLTILSILGGVGALLWKLGRKDQQFDSALTMLQSHAQRIDSHDSDFDALRSIIAELGKMQAVQARDHGDYDQKFRDIFQRISHLEQMRKKSVLET